MGFKIFQEIDAWKRSCRLAVDIYRITNQGEISKDWGLKDQIRRSAISISSNIAEGFERDSKAEFKRFCMIAKGSCGELISQLYITQAIGYIEKSDTDKLIDECTQISLMLGGLAKYLAKSK